MDLKCIFRGTIIATTCPGDIGDMVSDDKEKRKADLVDTGTNPNKTKELKEEEEPSVDVLQWYLKMILDSEDDPKTKK